MTYSDILMMGAKAYQNNIDITACPIDPIMVGGVEDCSDRETWQLGWRLAEASKLNNHLSLLGEVA